MTTKELFEFTIEKICSTNDERINAMLCPKLVDVDDNNKKATISFPVKDWQKNQRGECHGGMVATMFDTAMGTSAKVFSEHPNTATAELSITYIRPFLEDEYHFVIEAVNMGKNLLRLSGKAVSPITNKTMATAHATFVKLKVN